jgi:RHS repeat-associated protein
MLNRLRFGVFSLFVLVLFISCVVAGEDRDSFKKEIKPKLVISCYDSGNDHFVKDFVNVTKGNKSYTFYDKCKDENILIEYICSKNKKSKEEFGCENGCIDGACLTCEDTNNCGFEDITGEIILEDGCEDETPLEGCNLEGHRCIDFELIFDQTCFPEKVSVEFPGDEFIGETIYLYDGRTMVGKEFGDSLFYFINDYQGSLMTVTDGQTVVEEYTYLPFGENVDSSEGIYTGKEYDKDTDLYYYGARYYDSSKGRFTQIDPVENPGSPYKYAEGNPARYIDPDGRQVHDVTSSQFKKIYPDLMNNVEKHYQNSYKFLNSGSSIHVYINAEKNYKNPYVSDYFKENPDHFAFTSFDKTNPFVARVYFNPDVFDTFSKISPTAVESALNHELWHARSVMIDGHKINTEKEKYQNEIFVYNRGIVDDTERLKTETKISNIMDLKRCVECYKKSIKKYEFKLFLLDLDKAVKPIP